MRSLYSQFQINLSIIVEISDQTFCECYFHMEAKSSKEFASSLTRMEGMKSVHQTVAALASISLVISVAWHTRCFRCYAYYLIVRNGTIPFD